MAMPVGGGVSGYAAMCDTLGPPAYLPQLLPWLWRFWRAGTLANYEASLAAQAPLMRLAEAEWMGYRPSLPDSLPAIGRGRAPGVHHAFGHGHLGLTQAAATARLIRDLVLCQPLPIDLSPFSPRRF